MPAYLLCIESLYVLVGKITPFETCPRIGGGYLSDGQLLRQGSMPLLYSALHEHKQANNIRAGIEGAALLVELPSMSTRDGWARMVAAQHGEATTSTVHEVEGATTTQACERSIDPGPATVKLGQIHLLLNRAASLHGWLAPSPLSSCPAGCRHPPHAVMHQA